MTQVRNLSVNLNICHQIPPVMNDLIWNWSRCLVSDSCVCIWTRSCIKSDNLIISLSLGSDGSTVWINVIYEPVICVCNWDFMSYWTNQSKTSSIYNQFLQQSFIYTDLMWKRLVEEDNAFIYPHVTVHIYTF